MYSHLKMVSLTHTIYTQIFLNYDQNGVLKNPINEVQNLQCFESVSRSEVKAFGCVIFVKNIK